VSVSSLCLPSSKEETKKQKARERIRLKRQNPAYVQREREYTALRTQRRKYWINKYKISKSCSECGYNKHGAALDFDHLDLETKNFHIAQNMTNKRISVIVAEIRKCRILCSNCHRIHSYQQAQSRRKYFGSNASDLH
jgi:hypothetical protein